MDTYRIFVSSPGDAQFERLRVDRVVARLNGELAGAVRFVTVRWETEFYRAHDTFQAQIPLSTDCNIVVAIFRTRLGTELPPEFARMPDGEAYPSGTAYEVLTAIAKRRQGGELPDVFVFRCLDPPSVRIDDAASEEDVRRQWTRLKGFFARWFVSEEGRFRAAFQTFATTDDFEAQLERLLRDWLRDRMDRGGAVAWPIATMGSPYPGLQSFGPRHAPVFFGRARDTARAVEAWSEAGRRGTPFLVVVGASGSGKSSLARAGLVPRLTTPGVVATVDCWRVAALRPGESPDGPIAALAHALMQGAADLPRSEEGRLPALPEIAAGDYRTPADLAALLAHVDATVAPPILAALDKAGEAERAAQAMQRPARCDLVILVDQLDELFATAVDADARRRFARVLACLVATGRVWIVATLRADLYGLFLEEEPLFRLKEKGVAYDLAPPSLADMAEAVRGPARAANLAWEVDAATKESLDERLIRDIDRPDLLPIVQFVPTGCFNSTPCATAA
jgi:AAA ATPase domain